MEVEAVIITYESIKGEFQEKDFPEDVHNSKKVKFFDPKQRNLFVADYAVKFEELLLILSHYNGADSKLRNCRNSKWITT